MSRQIKKSYLPHIIILVLMLLFPIRTNAASLNIKKMTIATGTKKTLTINGANKKDVKWKSSNKRIATVSKNGVIKAIKKGKTKITATYKKKNYSCTVTVVNIKLNKKTGNIYVGSKLKLQVKGKPKTAKVKWSSSNNSIAKVINGNVTGLKSGTVNIYASCLNKKLVCKLTVNKKDTKSHYSFGSEIEGKIDSKLITGEKPETVKYPYGINYDRWGSEEKEVIDKLLSFRSDYPDGRPWTNLIYYHWNGGIYKGGYGCAALALTFSDMIFSKNAYFLNSMSQLRPGDIVYGSAHTIMVLDTDRSSYVIAVEGNVNKAIQWGYKYSFEELRDDGLTRILSRW